MIFSCGLLHHELRRRQKEWHDCFLLWPRTVGTRDGKHLCAWLQTVERSGEWGYDCMVWTYRLKAPK